ncbi:NTP transferase domain-containing protein [Roseospirillum parvum]|uniref:Phosphotransferase enzyme family protein n=1 Tax=Roseospirillum parvum TaxID=83401 RepID=A0A1G7UQ15_9PROT|nr:NTP transferase domain-containing protein [Roseospirillum parvum]SDG49209.1 Phosphotransferase enzyme family protein [Roseospirillum parvum]
MEIKDIGHVVVQAGGPGTRMQHHTWNKPKCLISVGGRPILYHLFAAFPGARFTVIGDYLFERLQSYLAANPPGVEVTLVRTTDKGTAAGVAAALDQVPDGAPLALVWSDLLVHAAPRGTVGTAPVVGLSRSFPCRWSMGADGGLVEESSERRGVAGFFAFPDKSWLAGVPARGEFVRWLSGQGWALGETFLDEVQEIGVLPALEEALHSATWSRFFNEVTLGETEVVKRPRAASHARLIDDEIGWYDSVRVLGFDRAPRVLGRRPLRLQRIDGRHAFELGELPRARRAAILGDVFATFERLHGLEGGAADRDALTDVYVVKTLDRVRQVGGLIPHLEVPEVRINGRLCANPFAPGREGRMAELAAPLLADCAAFRVIHGDPTFSNMLIDGEDKAWLIDPRGSFGQVRLFGDPRYDWAKLYYSVVGDYDMFNRRRFTLKVAPEGVEIDLASNGWADLKPMFTERFGTDGQRQLDLLHALIWLSLSGYVRDDLDSVLGAFYLGLWWLEGARGDG